MNRSFQLSKVNPGSFLFATSLGADILCVCPPTCGYYQSLHKVELLELDPELASGRGLTFESPRSIPGSGASDCKGTHVYKISAINGCACKGCRGLIFFKFYSF